jgi:CheY-like chemotaxis protein
MRARILVVEDNPDIVEMITSALEVEGYDVRSALDERVMQTVSRARDLLEATGYVRARAQTALDRAQATSNRWARRDTEGSG